MLFLLILLGCFFYLTHLNTKRIVVLGTKYITDHEVILASGYQNYPKLFAKKTSEIKANILKLDRVEDVKIKRNLLGKITFEIEEAIPLFYNRNNNKLILSNQDAINSTDITGIPILINYVPDSLYVKLIDGLKNMNEDVIHLISEIEYQPWKSNDIVIDETRFFLRMNDGNTVYINLIHLDKLNNYLEIYATLEDKKGLLYLDSSSDKISFSSYQ